MIGVRHYSPKLGTPLEWVSVAAVQDGRIYIERINGQFMIELKGSGSEFGAGLRYAIERGWLSKHESGTYVKLMPPGEDLLTRK
ncbi:hypothetical protein ACE102_45635 (plasmid) [Bradyrhizobium sp. vgs-9]|uniref:hypothetical protein n=1 Tax=Bradyrhizobium sp. vgs-9 TaxID=208389 RepID=UPI0035D5030B